MKQTTIDRKICELINLRLEANKKGKCLDQKYVVEANGVKWQNMTDKEAVTQIVLEAFGMI
jgi:hypothetical protein